MAQQKYSVSEAGRKKPIKFISVALSVVISVSSTVSVNAAFGRAGASQREQDLVSITEPPTAITEEAEIQIENEQRAVEIAAKETEKKKESAKTTENKAAKESTEEGTEKDAEKSEKSDAKPEKSDAKAENTKPVTKESGKENAVAIDSSEEESLISYYNSGTQMSVLPFPNYLLINRSGAPTEYKQLIKGKATAYTGDTETSTGRTPMPGHIAVDPEMIPYGTELYVTSADGSYIYGYCIAADTGGFVKMGNTTIDLFMNNEDMCLDWGNREVNIYVLK